MRSPGAVPGARVEGRRARISGWVLGGVAGRRGWVGTVRWYRVAWAGSVRIDRFGGIFPKNLNILAITSIGESPFTVQIPLRKTMREQAMTLQQTRNSPVRATRARAITVRLASDVQDLPPCKVAILSATQGGHR